MSYYIYGGGNFFIKKENFPAVIQALQDKWQGLSSCNTLDSILDHCGFEETGYDENGDLVHLAVLERKLWDQDEVLETIAPWAENESYLEMTGEDGDRWLWCVKDHKFYECPGEVSYRGDPYS